jgi:hypothetical protein
MKIRIGPEIRGEKNFEVPGWILWDGGSNLHRQKLQNINKIQFGNLKCFYSKP